MKSDLILLLTEVERKIGRKIHWQEDWDKLLALLKKHHISLKNLSPEALDKLALFAGFQSWKDFQEALRGQDDGETNYEA